MPLDLPPPQTVSIERAFENLCESAKKFNEEGLMDRKVCRAIYPKCMTEQKIAFKVMQDIETLFISLSQKHTKLVESINERLEKSVSKQKLIGVVSIEPKSLFSLEMFLRIQEDESKHRVEATKTYKAFLNLMKDLKEQKKEAMQSYDVFISDLKAFSFTLDKID